MNDRIRILYVHHGNGKCGACNSLDRMFHALDKDRFEPVVACGFNEPMAKSFFESRGLPLVNLATARFSHVAQWWPMYNPRGAAKTAQWLLLKQPEFRKRLETVLAEVSPDIVHLNSLTIAPVAPVVRRRHIPVVLHVREPVAAGTFGVRRAWLRHLARRHTNQVIYICRDNRDRLTGPMDHASVLYNPIPFARSPKMVDREVICQELGIPQGASVLFFPGGSNLTIKGVFTFLAALAELREQAVNVCAIIPGIDGDPKSANSERGQIDRKIEALGLESAVIRAPFIGAVQRYYAASDVVVAPFSIAHFSLAVVEAGAMEKPVVGSRVGGIEEVLADGKNGLLVPPRDHVTLMQKIRELLDRPAEAHRMGQEGRHQAVELCHPDKYAAGLARLYEAVLHN